MTENIFWCEILNFHDFGARNVEIAMDQKSVRFLDHLIYHYHN